MRDLIKYFLIFLIVIWIFGFFIIFPNNSKNSNTDANEKIQADLLDQLKRVESELALLQEINNKNEAIIKDLKEQADNYEKRLKQTLQSLSTQDKLNNNDKIPSKNFEKIRRKIFDDIKDVSYFINSQFSWFKSLQLDQQKLDFIHNNFQDRINVLTAEIYNLSISDNLGNWRKTEAINLSNKVQKRFSELQNPNNCDNSKKIICDLTKSCGFGCQMHHAMYCFITAYFTNRTMILESNGWRYNSQGYEAYFKRVSKDCKVSKDDMVGWNERNKESDPIAIKMPIIDIVNEKPEFFPLSVPKEYFESLSKFHGDPFVWWAGQILSYLMRFNENFEQIVKKTRQDLKFQTPCVGVHVRRTDKIGTEAAYHSLNEYMKYVKEYFDIYDLKHGTKSKRSVYLASDEPSVLAEAKSNYKDYNFLMNEANAKSASLDLRYSAGSGQGVILDIHFLSECDYLVCTFSSQVCRMAYELMQTRYPDASWRFKSLDDVYYYGGQTKHNVIAIYDHIPLKNSEEMEIKVGDLIGLAGNHWNGYSKGRNLRTNQIGLFPSYKVVNVVESY